MDTKKTGEELPVVDLSNVPIQEQDFAREIEASDAEVALSKDESRQSDSVERKAEETVSVVAPVQELVQRDPELVRIESVLSNNIGDLYSALPQDIKPLFKAKGEELAGKIQVMMMDAKMVAGKVLKLIRAWLGMVPNINKLYLEQESKIKTDKIMELSKKDS